MLLNENKLVPFKMTNKSKRRQKLLEASNRVLKNKQAEIGIVNENSLSYSEQLRKESLNSYKAANKFNKRKLLAEKANFRKELEMQLFKESVIDVFFESLLLDESVKERNRSNIEDQVESLLENYIEENNITLKDLAKKNVLLENLVLLCEKTAKCVSEEEYSKKGQILNELDKVQQDNELSEYEVEDEEVDNDNIKSSTSSEFDENKEFLTKSITAEIKETVIDTIQKEQETSKKLEEEKQEINQITDYSKDGIDPETNAPEATTAGEMTGGESNVPDSGDTEEVKEEITSKTQDGSAPATKPQKKLVESSKPLTITRNKKPAVRTIYNEIMTQIAKKEVMKNNSILAESNIDMNLVMANSITYYTLLETMKTIGIIDNKPSELRKAIKTMLK